MIASIMRAGGPTGTVTFLFTDVEGSTKLLHELGDETYAQVLAEHRRIVREACVRQGGVEVDTQGDAFFFAFPAAPGAIAAASDMTERLASGPIQVRIGLHTGTPLVTDEGYVGNDVHFAARVAATGHGGQIVLSHATAELVTVAVTLLGSHRLKDIAEPVSIYQLGDRSFPPLKTIANSNLPTPASSFLGREEELYAADLCLQEARLLTITGPGGAGKTRFALELARRAREERFSDYRDGVFACFLAPLRDPALVLPTLCQTLSVREEPGKSALETLASHLEGKKMLLLLDNVEHLLACASELSELLSASPGLTLLVTSRELLRVQGEVAYEVPPLLPDEGVALFCERARMEPTETIRALCERLEGLPLAIELAAARMRILSPEQLAERLAQRLDLLKAGRDAHPRQQTLRATIEWSYDLLTPEEQQLFARLSVFAGGCTLEAAEEVAEAELDTVESLVDKSLLRYSQGRFWMLETIREFAKERLGESDAESLRKRHSEWFVRLGEGLAEEVQQGNAEATAVFRDENDNLRSALSWLLEIGDESSAAAAIWPLSFFWIRHGYVNEGYTWARRLFDPSEAITPDRVWGAMGAGELARFSGDTEAATRFKEATIGTLRHMGEERWVAATLSDLSDLAGTDGDLERARALSEEALALRTTLGDSRGIAHALAGLALVEFRAGDFERADTLFAQSRSSWPRGSALWAECELMVAQCRRRLGHLHEAREAFRHSLPVLAKTEPAFLPELLQEVGALALVNKRSTCATRLLAVSDVLWDDVGMPRWDLDDYERNVADLREALGDEFFEAQWRVGSRMPSDEALAFALSCLD